MSATNANSVLETLDLDTAIIDSLPESVLSELIGFIEYDGRLRRREQQAYEQQALLCTSPGSAGDANAS
ncbi:MAG TPA: hypothetical protein VF306_00615 [Pirellulales bacterium]